MQFKLFGKYISVSSWNIRANRDEWRDKYCASSFGIRGETVHALKMAEVLYAHGYWGLLGVYRDMERQHQYLKKIDGIHNCCIQDIEHCKYHIKRIIDFTIDEGLIDNGDDRYQEFEKMRELGLEKWAKQYVDEGY